MIVNAHRGRPEIKAQTSIDDLKWQPASNDEVAKHQQIIGYFEKFVSEIVSYGRRFGTSEFEILTEEDFKSAQLPNRNVLLSMYNLMEKDGNYKRYDIRLNRDSLAKIVKPPIIGPV